VGSIPRSTQSKGERGLVGVLVMGVVGGGRPAAVWVGLSVRCLDGSWGGGGGGWGLGGRSRGSQNWGFSESPRRKRATVDRRGKSHIPGGEKHQKKSLHMQSGETGKAARQRASVEGGKHRGQMMTENVVRLCSRKKTMPTEITPKKPDWGLEDDQGTARGRNMFRISLQILGNFDRGGKKTAS